MSADGGGLIYWDVLADAVSLFAESPGSPAAGLTNGAAARVHTDSVAIRQIELAGAASARVSELRPVFPVRTGANALGLVPAAHFGFVRRPGHRWRGDYQCG